VKTVFIGNLPPSVNEEKVLDMFKEFGEVQCVALAGVSA
jgi:RNA recognition motif-containing protein